METLKQGDYSYMLQQSLTDLHQESLGWISEIEFMKTEFAYFNKVLELYDSSAPTLKMRELQASLREELYQLRDKVIINFETEVKSHEAYLSELLESTPGYSDTSYRDKHLSVTIRHKELDRQYHAFKKEIIHFVLETSFNQ